jgi:hypothetical protein
MARDDSCLDLGAKGVILRRGNGRGKRHRVAAMPLNDRSVGFEDARLVSCLTGRTNDRVIIVSDAVCRLQMKKW